MRMLIFGMLFAGYVYAQPLEKILAESCAACLSGQKPAGALRLDTPANALLGCASGAAVVPGDAEASPLYRRITTTDRALRMPPAGPPLAPAALEAIQQRIESRKQTRADFAADIRPILRRNYACHSGTQPKAQLRLDIPAGVQRGGIGGPVLVAGKPDESRLIHRVEGRNGEQRMPLKGEPLNDTDVALMRSRIEPGAQLPADVSRQELVIEKHWSYRKPFRPPVPKVRTPGAVGSPIDAFVLSQLEERGLSLSPAAPKEILIRRVSLDLIALPPSPAEVAAFVNDTRPGAYEQLVERLLASQDYQERWARHWLDLARYADTDGFEADRRRTMRKYGGGIKAEVTIGRTDDVEYNIVERPVSVHDLHATLLDLMGIDHTKLTNGFQGRDFRLTDVHGELVREFKA
jgi:hypothetical protein